MGGKFMNRKVFYTIVVILMTATSTVTMLYNYEGYYAADLEYEQTPVNIINYEDREYLGYIFDDYNKQVNLDYVDKVYKTFIDKSESLEDMSFSVMNMEKTVDNIRALRSERIIEERAVKDGILRKGH